MSNDLQSDLTADLLRDLSAPRPLPTATPADLSPTPVRPGTPAFSVTFTPLRWSRLSVRGASVGTGVSVRGGPWRVELAF